MAGSSDPIDALLGSDLVERVKLLELFARTRVEGMRTGENASRLLGSSTEFQRHRQYAPGDNIRRLDWRVYARNERLYVRQYEELTNVPLSILIDTSGSMGHGPVGETKLDVAVRCAAVLGYLAVVQHDGFSLAAFADQLTTGMPSGSSRRHLARAFEVLVSLRSAGRTRFESCLALADSRLGRRGLVIVLSDFMDDPALIARALGRFRHRGHDVVALQIYSPDERELEGVDFTRFSDLEDGSTIGVDPQLVREEYQRQFDLHQVAMRDACLAHGVDHALVPAGQPVEVVLGSWLRRRAGV